MTTNDYGVEVTEEVKQLGERAVKLAEEAAELWAQFVEQATGEVDEGTAGGTLEEAIEDMQMDFVRFAE